MKLRVGDVCEIIGMEKKGRPDILRFNGTEFEIVGGYARRYGDDTKKYRYCYECRCALDGQVWLIQPKNLRLKRPPSWNDWLYSTKEVEGERDTERSVEGV